LPNLVVEYSGAKATVSGTITILLACNDANLTGDLRQARPDYDVRAADRSMFDAALSDQIWCFIDWLLPDMSGLEVCRRLRAASATAHAHITMILDEDDRDLQRRALHAGADDYLVGPLDIKRLIQRLDLYQSADRPEMPVRKLMHGDLMIDTSAYKAQYRGKPLFLGPTEFRLLTHFMEHPDRVFSRQSLIGIVGKDGRVSDDRTVNVWVGRLRKAFAASGVPDPLRTVRSVGYVFDRV
jgi:two-component system, OmpR family, phosphate regulon response regulator PhoB